MGQRSVRFPDDLEKRAEAAAESRERSFSYIVVKALECWLFDRGQTLPGPEEALAGSVESKPRYRAVAGSTPVPAPTSPSVPMFKCRHGDFRAASPKARCPNHGGALVPD